MPKTIEKKTNKKWIVVIVILALMLFVGLILAGILGAIFASDEIMFSQANVAVVPIRGVITIDGFSGPFSQAYASSDEIVNAIEKADSAGNIKVIVLEINSPGGGVVASEEIMKAVKETDKDTIALIREIGASGGYWVASASDTIFASPVSITGSLGVIGSYLEYAGIMEEYNITYRRLVSGQYKDAGSPLKELSKEEKAMLQNKINKVQEYFKKSVLENRVIKPEDHYSVFSGQIFLGEEALSLGLVDELGGKKEVLKYIQENYNITPVLVKVEEEKGLLELLMQSYSDKSFRIGQGIGDALVEKSKTDAGFSV